MFLNLNQFSTIGFFDENFFIYLEETDLCLRLKKNDKKIGIYIKYSKKIISPWRFTFLKEHQDEFKIMNELCENSFLILVCNKDGIASIKYKDIKKVLDEHHEEAEWISASRLKRESYAIKGSDGKLKFKINLRDFQRDIIKCL